MSDDKFLRNDELDNNFSKKIEVSETISIVISKSVWKNMDRLDIRTYLKTENYTGPTKKGINVPIEKIDDIISALQEIKKIGLIQ